MTWSCSWFLDRDYFVRALHGEGRLIACGNYDRATHRRSVCRRDVCAVAKLYHLGFERNRLGNWPSPQPLMTDHTARNEKALNNRTTRPFVVRSRLLTGPC